MAEKPEPTRDQIALEYAKALAVIDELRQQRDNYRTLVEQWKANSRENTLIAEGLSRERDELLSALKAVLAEIEGCVGIAKEQIREAIGSTNLTVLAVRCQHAESVIAKVEAR
jgi:hypothetical protein